jgi:hypothetical protein
MAQVVEVQVPYAGSLGQSLPRQSDGIAAERENKIVIVLQAVQNIACVTGQRDRSGIAILGLWDKQRPG